MKHITSIAVLLVAASLFAGCRSKSDTDEHEHNHDDHAGQELAQVLPAGANKLCPILTEEKVNPSLYVEYQGKKIYVCCKKCLKRVQENPAAAYAKAYPEQGHEGHQH